MTQLEETQKKLAGLNQEQRDKLKLLCAEAVEKALQAAKDSLASRERELMVRDTDLLQAKSEVPALTREKNRLEVLLANVFSGSREVLGISKDCKFETVVFVFDCSSSMDKRVEGTRLWDRSVDIAESWIRNLRGNSMCPRDFQQ